MDAILSPELSRLPSKDAAASRKCKSKMTWNVYRVTVDGRFISLLHYHAPDSTARSVTSGRSSRFSSVSVSILAGN